MVLLPIYLNLLDFGDGVSHATFTMFFTLGCGFMMVSNIPTFSGKNVSEKIRRDLVLPFMIVAVILVAATVSYPWKILSAIALLYLASIPFSIRNHGRYVKRHINSESEKP